MTADTSIDDETRKEVAAELRRYARQASEAAGSFIRWSVYLETDSQAAVTRMRKVLTTVPTETTSPFLPIIAEMTLAKIDPASVELCRQRREQFAQERAERAEWHRQYWELRENKGEAAANSFMRRLGKKNLPAEYFTLDPADREKVDIVIRELAGVSEPAPSRSSVKGQDGNVVSVKFGGAS